MCVRTDKFVFKNVMSLGKLSVNKNRLVQVVNTLRWQVSFTYAKTTAIQLWCQLVVLNVLTSK
jgi:hypothetical protein